MTQFTRDRIDHGYKMIPNGLWTLDVSANARVLLGWLHSHTDQFLAALTVNKCRRIMGTSAITKYLEELERAGFVTIDRTVGKGSAWNFHLHGEPWVALSDRKVSQPWTGTEPTLDRLGEPTLARVEEPSLEEPEIETRHVSETLTSEPDTSFESFWKTYPRKEGKLTASRRWDKMSSDERLAAGDALVHWCDHYATIEAKFIPHGSTWLNQRRWEDQLPDTETPPEVAPVTPVGCDVCDFTGWVEVEDVTLRAGVGLAKCECQKPLDNR